MNSSYLLVLLGVVMVSYSGPLVKVGLAQGANPATIAMMRMAVTALILLPVMFIRRKGQTEASVAALRRMTRSQWLWSVAASLFLALHYLTRLGEGKLPQVAASLIAWVTAAVSKFLVLYGIVNGLVCGLLSPSLLESGMLKPPMLKLLPATFGWPQLVTALIGGGLALSIVPVLRRALKKNKE